MTPRFSLAMLALSLAPALAVAQAPLADAFRDDAKSAAKNLIAGAEAMPADKYDFKPTPAQMSFGDIVKHLSGGNDILCGTIGGMKAPARPKLDPTADKAALVGRLKETFAFCEQALAKLDDAKLSEQIKMFGNEMASRAAAEVETIGDWADHYSQMAIYLRLNGKLPPTAKK